MRVFFYKPDLAWPRSSGHDVHTYQMMRALGALGVTVGLATQRSLADEALQDSGLDRHVVLDPKRPGGPQPEFSALQSRFVSYWGTSEGLVSALAAEAQDFRADVLAVSGLDVLPMLGAPGQFRRVWYAGDEWVWHHLSMVRPFDVSTWSDVRQAVEKGAYERAFGPRLDRVWVVTPADARAMRVVAGVKAVDVLPNGVDIDQFAPCDEEPESDLLTFWGRLDFGPNIQALDWFLDRVWGTLLSRRPATRFDIYGFQAGPAATRWASMTGVRVIPDRPDIRTDIGRASLVVLPFVSGGGIKNKLLEAAAMGKAIIATPRTLNGLNGCPPVCTASGAVDWVNAVEKLLHDPETRRLSGAAARDWVTRHHTWESAARLAVAGLEQTLRQRHR